MNYFYKLVLDLNIPLAGDGASGLFEIMVFSYAEDVLLVPKPRVVDNWFNFTHSFSISIWLLIIAVFLFVRVAFHLKSHVAKKIKRRDDCVTNLDTFGLFVMQALCRPPRRRVSKCILFFAFTMCIYFSAMYSSGIIRALFTPKYFRLRSIFSNNSILSSYAGNHESLHDIRHYTVMTHVSNYFHFLKYKVICIT